MQNEMAGKRACVVVESFEEVLATSRHSRAVVEFNFGHRPEQIHALCGPNGNDLKQKLGQLQRDWCLGSMV